MYSNRINFDDFDIEMTIVSSLRIHIRQFSPIFHHYDRVYLRFELVFNGVFHGVFSNIIDLLVEAENRWDIAWIRHQPLEI